METNDTVELSVITAQPLEENSIESNASSNHKAEESKKPNQKEERHSFLNDSAGAGMEGGSNVNAMFNITLVEDEVSE